MVSHVVPQIRREFYGPIHRLVSLETDSKFGANLRRQTVDAFYVPDVTQTIQNPDFFSRPMRNATSSTEMQSGKRWSTVSNDLKSDLSAPFKARSHSVLKFEQDIHFGEPWQLVSTIQHVNELLCDQKCV